MMWTGQTLAQEETAAQLWERLEGVSRDRVVAKHKALLDEPNGVFGDLLGIEADRAYAAKDPIFQTPDWPERIAERVYAKYQALPAVAATAAPTPQAQPPAVAPVSLPQIPPLAVSSTAPEVRLPQGPIHKPKLVGSGMGWFVVCIFVGLCWAIYLSERQKKAKLQGLPDLGIGRVPFLLHLVCTVFVVTMLSGILNTIVYDRLEGSPSLIVYSIPMAFPIIARLKNIGLTPWVAIFAIIPLPLPGVPDAIWLTVWLGSWIALLVAPQKKQDEILGGNFSHLA